MKSYRGNYILTNLESVADIFHLHYRFMDSFVYRGHADSDWKLLSTLVRTCKNYNKTDNGVVYPSFYENEMINDFKYKYRIYKEFFQPGDNEIIEWLSIMQHYGAPTRLIDFSDSFFVALYMAISDLYDKDGAIWCLNRHACRFQFKDGQYGDDKSMYDMANQILIDIPHYEPKKVVYLVKPKYANERLIKQQGLFAMPGCEYISLIENLSPILKNTEGKEIKISVLIMFSNDTDGFGANDFCLIKIIIPKDLKFEIFHMLLKMNITAETLFPGLEGLAKSVNYPRMEFCK